MRGLRGCAVEEGVEKGGLAYVAAAKEGDFRDGGRRDEAEGGACIQEGGVRGVEEVGAEFEVVGLWGKGGGVG